MCGSSKFVTSSFASQRLLERQIGKFQASLIYTYIYGSFHMKSTKIPIIPMGTISELDETLHIKSFQRVINFIKISASCLA